MCGILHSRPSPKHTRVRERLCQHSRPAFPRPYGFPTILARGHRAAFLHPWLSAGHSCSTQVRHERSQLRLQQTDGDTGAHRVHWRLGAAGQGTRRRSVHNCAAGVSTSGESRSLVASLRWQLRIGAAASVEQHGRCAVRGARAFSRCPPAPARKPLHPDRPCRDQLPEQQVRTQ